MLYRHEDAVGIIHAAHEIDEHNRHAPHWNEIETVRRQQRVIERRYFATLRTNS